jgi:uncharacterized damage-inducible protein DinB
MGTTPFLKKASATIVEATLQEFMQEAAITRRVLARVPANQLAWRPHPKSMSLGVLALHVASGPGVFVGWIAAGTADLTGGDNRPQPDTAAAILAAHEQSLQAVKATLAHLGDSVTRETCTLRKNGATFMTMPKLAVLRTLVMNHWIHHRGQLTVYLRLLDVPVPSMYGPSADEQPFTQI